MEENRFADPCSECPLDGDCVSIKVRKSSGKPKRRKIRIRGLDEHTNSTKFLVVAPPVSEERAESNAVLGRASSKIFMEHLKKYGLQDHSMVLIPSIRCGYDAKMHLAKERRVIETLCREYIIRAIEDYQPEAIITLGADAASTVIGRKVKITKARGVPVFSEKVSRWVYPMLDPTFVHLYPQNAPTFDSDVANLARVLRNDWDLEAVEQEVLGEYEFIFDLQHLIDNAPARLSFDLETLGLKPAQDGSKILTMQFCTEPGKAQMLVWDHPENPVAKRRKKKLIQQLKQVLQNPETEVVGQNLKFDAVWILHKFGFRFRMQHDTLMLYTLIDENTNEKNLDMLTKRYVPSMAGYADSFNSKWDKSRMDKVPLRQLLDYGCGDVDATFRVLDELIPQARKDRKLWKNYINVSMAGLNAFVPMEVRGMLTDEIAFDEFQHRMEVTVETQRRELLNQVPRSIKRKHVEKGLSFTRDVFIRDILFDHEDGFELKPVVFTASTEKLPDHLKKPSTSSKNHLPYFYDECPFTEDLSQHVKDCRMLTYNVYSFREKYIIHNRVYPSYSLTTAKTGRTSSYDPNGQNFPKRGDNAKAYRRTFVPPPGYVMLEADLSQAELRISADMAREPTMIRIYQKGGDIHKETACIVLGCTMEEFNRLSKAEQKDARFKAKAVNFGFIYGMGWRKFVRYAKTQYGVEFTDREAQNIRIAYFRKYANLPVWHTRMREFVRANKYVRSYSGRVRHLPTIDSPEEFIRQEAERQGINSPVQEFGSSLGVMAISRLDRDIDSRYLAITGFVHDAIYALVPEKYVVWGAKTLKRYMETNPIRECFGVNMRIPILADVGFGWNGGDTYEMEGLDLKRPYDFSELIETDEDGNIVDDPGSRLPPQKRPPNNGRLEEAPYEPLAA